MKSTLLFAVAAMTTLVLGAFSAEARYSTCSQHAATCAAKGGGSACYTAVAKCKQTCIFEAPRRNWPAAGDCGGGKVQAVSKKQRN